MGRAGLAMYLIDKDIIDKRNKGQQEIDPELKSILRKYFAVHVNKVIHWHEDVRGAFAISGPMMWWWLVGLACYVGVEKTYTHFGIAVRSFPLELVAIPALILWMTSVMLLIALFMVIRSSIVNREGRRIRKIIAVVPRGAEAYNALIASEPNPEYQELFRSFAELPMQNAPRT